MMKTALFACETIRDEIQHALRETGAAPEMVWIESGLHNSPELLRSVLQQKLDALEGVGRVLMAFGQCGHATEQLVSGDFEMVFPRVDDCITLLLGSMERRTQAAETHGAYFLTKGWLAGERNIWAEYQYAVKKYGAKRAPEIVRIMLGNYKRILVLDTGSYDIESILPQTRLIADTFQLLHEIVPTGIGYLKELLTGPWDDGERFLVVPPRRTVGRIR